MSLLVMHNKHFYRFIHLNLTIMTKPFSIAAFFLLVAICSSCKKDYTCTCTLETRGQNHNTTQSSVTITYTNVTKGNARAKCNQEAANYNATNLLNYMSECAVY